MIASNFAGSDVYADIVEVPTTSHSWQTPSLCRGPSNAPSFVVYIRVVKCFRRQTPGSEHGLPLYQLSQHQFAISLCGDRIAALAELWVAAAVAHDPADLLALDIAVDAGHPGVDLSEQQALARRNDVVGPRNGTGRGGLDEGQAAVASETDQPGDPIGGVL